MSRSWHFWLLKHFIVYVLKLYGDELLLLCEVMLTSFKTVMIVIQWDINRTIIFNTIGAWKIITLLHVSDRGDFTYAEKLTQQSLMFSVFSSKQCIESLHTLAVPGSLTVIVLAAVLLLFIGVYDTK